MTHANSTKAFGRRYKHTAFRALVLVFGSAANDTIGDPKLFSAVVAMIDRPGVHTALGRFLAERAHVIIDGAVRRSAW